MYYPPSIFKDFIICVVCVCMCVCAYVSVCTYMDMYLGTTEDRKGHHIPWSCSNKKL